MSKLKVGVYQICKNEQGNVMRWYNSIKDEQDGIFVTDTGSTDGTLEIFKNLKGINLFEQKIIPWRFDVQRNTQLNNVPNDYDVLVSLDLDEAMKQGWREEIEKNWEDKLNLLMYYYIEPQRGNIPESKNLREKIHRRDHIYWKYPIHEFTKFEDREGMDKNDTSKFVDNIICYHYPDPTRNRGYLNQIIEQLKIEEFKNDDYLYYVLGMEYEKINEFENIRKQNYRFLELSYKQNPKDIDIGNIKMRSECMNSVQRSILNEKQSDELTEKDITDQLQWIMKQTAENMFYKENWIFQQRLWGMLGNYSMVYACSKFQIYLYNIDDPWSIQQNRLSGTEYPLQMMKFQADKLKSDLLSK